MGSTALAELRAAGTDRGERTRRLTELVTSAPELLACAMAGFAIVPMVMLLAGHLILPVAIPLGLLAALVAAAICRTSPEAVGRRELVSTVAAGTIALAWFVVNSFFSAEDLYAHRDPTTYNLAGRWLMDHQSLPIPTHPELFGSPVGYVDGSAGFSNSSIGEVYAQGNHLLPVLLAAAGRMFGTSALLKANVAFGAMALFVFFGLARRVVGPVLALVVMSALAVSLPMIYVSRDTFSEPLALLYLMGGLLLLHRAIAYGRVRDYALAGFVAGTAAMARIDTDASLLALIVVAMVVLARAPVVGRRPAALRAGALVGCAVVPAVIGWLDVAWLANGYYHDERTHILLQAKAAVVFAVVGAVVVAFVWRPAVRARLTSTRWRHRGAAVASGLIIAAFAVLASRPLWFVGHGGLTLYLIQVQHQAGDAIDGTRTYNEQTVNWQALYFGWPTILLAVIGYVLLVRRLLRDRDYVLLGLLTMGLAISALYLWTAQITPDQPWASRRFLPVIMPLLLVAAAVALRAVYPRLGRLGRASAVLGATAMVAIPLMVTAPVFGVREEVPQLAQVEAICAQVGTTGAILEVDHDSLWGYAQTMRSYCNVPSIGLLGASPAQLAGARAALAQRGKTLYVLAVHPTSVAYDKSGAAPSAFSVAKTTRWPSTLHSAPTGSMIEVVPVYLGLVEADGLVKAISAAS